MGQVNVERLESIARHVAAGGFSRGGFSDEYKAALLGAGRTGECGTAREYCATCGSGSFSRGGFSDAMCMPAEGQQVAWVGTHDRAIGGGCGISRRTKTAVGRSAQGKRCVDSEYRKPGCQGDRCSELRCWSCGRFSV